MSRRVFAKNFASATAEAPPTARVSATACQFFGVLPVQDIPFPAALGYFPAQGTDAGPYGIVEPRVVACVAPHSRGHPLDGFSAVGDRDARGLRERVCRRDCDGFDSCFAEFSYGLSPALERESFLLGDTVAQAGQQRAAVHPGGLRSHRIQRGDGLLDDGVLGGEVLLDRAGDHIGDLLEVSGHRRRVMLEQVHRYGAGKLLNLFALHGVSGVVVADGLVLRVNAAPQPSGSEPLGLKGCKRTPVSLTAGAPDHYPVLARGWFPRPGTHFPKASRGSIPHAQRTSVLATKPLPLRRGDTVALTAPAGAWNPERLAAGVEQLEKWGLRVLPPPTDEILRYMSGPDEARGSHLQRCFENPEVGAILAARGGFGCARALPYFDPGAAARNPKIFCGFSDVSLFLNTLVDEANLISFHGPMPAADLLQLSDADRERFRRFLFGEGGWWDGRFSEVWRPGLGSGQLAGGCLSILVTTLGTPYELDTRGKVLFLEDVAERPYRVDRMLTHLRHAGKLESVRGIIFGAMLDCDDGQGPEVLREIALDVLDGLQCPIAFGLDAGHGSGNVALPIGCLVALDTRRGELELLEEPLGTWPPAGAR